MIRIGTRGSELALWQARFIADLIGRDRTEIVIIKTKGDRIQNVSFDKMEGKGFFTKEIEEALLGRRIDLAVHSMKDLPTEETPGLVIASVTEREDPSDVLLIRQDFHEAGKMPPLRDGTAVGTSSLRRAAQVRLLNGSLEIRALRGNVTTRVKRLREGRFGAILIARAGLRRLALDLGGLAVFSLPFSHFLPAPAQGALALQIRSGEPGLAEDLRRLNHAATERAVTAERAFLRHFGGGCHIPLGALAVADGVTLHLTGVIAAADGRASMKKTLSGTDPLKLGEEMAELMKKEGADRLLSPRE